MRAFVQDLRHAARHLRRSPAFAVLAIATLGLGLGATTTIFTTINAVMLRPLPYHDPDRLVMLWETNAERGWVDAEVAPANWLDWRERVKGFQDIAMVSHYQSGLALAGPDGNATEIQVGYASGNFFSVLGVTPLLGRSYTWDEAWDPSARGVVLTYAAWQRLYGGDTSIVGRDVQLDGHGYRVQGVLPREFRFDLIHADAWVPFTWTLDNRDQAWFRRAHLARAVGRLAPGVSPTQAREQLAAVAGQLQREHPDLNRAMEADFKPLQDYLVGDRKATLLVLLGAVSLLLLIACGNVANLMLVRTAGRQRELAVRAALGAAGARLLRQMLTEALVLALGAAVIGGLLGVVGVRWVLILRPDDLGDIAVHLDWRMFAFAAGMTAMVTALSGAVPAWRATRVDLREAMGDGSPRGGRGRRAVRLADGLAVLEIALALMVVAGAGLMLRSLQQLQRVDPGIDPDNVLTFAILPPSGAYPNDQRRAELVERFLDDLEGVPGVVHAGAARGIPLTFSGWTGDFAIEGRDREAFGINVRHQTATPGYLQAMGIPILKGGVYARDIPQGGPYPILINQALADQFFPNEDPVGHRLANDRYPDERSFWYTIVGVVGNTRGTLTGEPEIQIIDHFRFDTPGTPWFAVKTNVPPMSVVPSIQATLRAIDPSVPLVSVRTMDEVSAAAMSREQFMLVVLSVFAGLALLLAGVGVYGVTSQVARARLRDIGIRMALGAPRDRILREVVTGRLQFVVAGVGIGLVGALVGARLLSGFLYGIGPTDPATLVVVVGVLSLVAIGTSTVPAWRASRSDPLGVLRTD